MATTLYTTRYTRLNTTSTILDTAFITMLAYSGVFALITILMDQPELGFLAFMALATLAALVMGLSEWVRDIANREFRAYIEAKERAEQARKEIDHMLADIYMREWDTEEPAPTELPSVMTFLECEDIMDRAAVWMKNRDIKRINLQMDRIIGAVETLAEEEEPIEPPTRKLPYKQPHWSTTHHAGAKSKTQIRKRNRQLKALMAHDDGSDWPF